MKRAAAALVVLLAGVGVIAQLSQAPAIKHHILVSAVGTTPLSVADLTEAADVVAVVRPTGNDRVHWNNAANSRWEPTDERLAMIYNDQEVIVVDVLRGTGVGRVEVVRNIGGVVGDTRFELEGLEPLDPNRWYVLFLETVATPTQEGSETVLSFVAQDQGVFIAAGDGYVNDFGLSVRPQDLAADE